MTPQTPAWFTQLVMSCDEAARELPYVSEVENDIEGDNHSLVDCIIKARVEASGRDIVLVLSFFRYQTGFASMVVRRQGGDRLCRLTFDPRVDLVDEFCRRASEKLSDSIVAACTAMFCEDMEAAAMVS